MQVLRSRVCGLQLLRSGIRSFATQKLWPATNLQEEASNHLLFPSYGTRYVFKSAELFPKMKMRSTVARSAHSTAFSPATMSRLASMFDLSEYLLNGSDWRKAPKIPELVGPVRIGRTRDGRGRGLFLTRDVSAGDLLIANNAFAAAYDDEDNNQMCAKILETLKDNPRALHQFYSLSGTDNQDSMDIPSVDLYDYSVSYAEVAPPPKPIQFDEGRIRHIVQVNSFSGKLKSPSDDQEVKVNGLWLLPSFINHSCCPNTSRLLVGEAMLFVATRDMKSREEITISYTDCMAPLKKREDLLKRTGYGFLCQCKRCTLERSLQDQLSEISECYHSLYDKAAEEVYSVVTKRAPGPYPASKELGSMYDKLKGKVAELENLTQLHKQWILGGYSSAFLANFITHGYSSDFAQPEEFANESAVELAEAMQATVPGMLRTLSFAVILATVSPKLEHRSMLVQLSMDECLKIYGKQRPDVIKKMALQAVELVPFF